MLDFNHYVQKFRASPGQNDAAAYDVKIVTVPGAEWRVIGVHLLTGDENGGKRNVFIEPIDASGKRVAGVVVEYTWEGRRPDEPAPPTALDKPPNEVAGNIPLGAGQVATVWIRGTSDRVSGLTTSPNIPDVPGATRFHQSHLVVFQRGSAAPPPPPPPAGDCTAYIVRIAKLESAIADAVSRLEALRTSAGTIVFILKNA